MIKKHQHKFEHTEGMMDECLKCKGIAECPAYYGGQCRAIQNLKNAMKNPHAQKLGRLGGLKKTPRKTKASRLNGKKGGRPKKSPLNTAKSPRKELSTLPTIRVEKYD